MWKRALLFIVLFTLSLVAAPSVETAVTSGNTSETARFIFTVASLLLLNLYIFFTQRRDKK